MSELENVNAENLKGRAKSGFAAALIPAGGSTIAETAKGYWNVGAGLMAPILYKGKIGGAGVKSFVSAIGIVAGIFLMASNPLPATAIIAISAAFLSGEIWDIIVNRVGGRIMAAGRESDRFMSHVFNLEANRPNGIKGILAKMSAVGATVASIPTMGGLATGGLKTLSDAIEANGASGPNPSQESPAMAENAHAQQSKAVPEVRAQNGTSADVSGQKPLRPVPKHLEL